MCFNLNHPSKRVPHGDLGGNAFLPAALGFGFRPVRPLFLAIGPVPVHGDIALEACNPFARPVQLIAQSGAFRSHPGKFARRCLCCRLRQRCLFACLID